MDSTSPMHRGFQEWRASEDWTWHGNKHGSMEGLGALNGQVLDETVDLMYRAMDGQDCPCGN